jgi:hypothetical protein
MPLLVLSPWLCHIVCHKSVTIKELLSSYPQGISLRHDLYVNRILAQNELLERLADVDLSLRHELFWLSLHNNDISGQILRGYQLMLKKPLENASSTKDRSGTSSEE